MHTLLIADDEQLERDAIDLLVKKHGLELTTIKARNGREAVEAAQERHIDIAMLDIRMPGLSGIEAAKRIAEIAPDCRIIFLTAWDSFDFAREAIRLGAKDYLVKPASPQDVITLLNRLIGELQEHAMNREPESIEDIRNILNQFNRSLFASIKYGLVPTQAMRDYFSMQGITETQGIAVIADGIQEAVLPQMLGKVMQSSLYKACYFPAVDRISLLLFAAYPEVLSASFTQDRLLLACPSCHTGIGRPFYALEEIPRALRQASQSYFVAVQKNKQLLRYDDEAVTHVFDREQEFGKSEQELIDAVMDMRLGDARRIAHHLQDRLSLQHAQDPSALLEHFYELVLHITKSIRVQIPLFTYESVQKSSLMELERYLMDFLDEACAVIESDRKDKYVRIFTAVDAYMRNRYAEQLSLEQMAAFAQISPNYFSRLCKEYLGASFTDHLSSIRMDAAKQMIRTGMKIQEVAALTGFSDYSYFSRVFRNSEGLSPRKFQQQQKKP